MNQNPVQLKINYLGIEFPSNPAEINFEIAGLETAAAEIQYRIFQLKQAVALANLSSEEKK